MATQEEDKNFLNSLSDKTKESIENLKSKFGLPTTPGTPWPQTQTPTGDLKSIYPNYTTRGFLPPILISPTKKMQKESTDEDPEGQNLGGGEPEKKSFGNYLYTDWRGQQLKLESESGTGDTKTRFIPSLTIPKTKSEIPTNPYSIRDHYLIFGDNSQDYFRHGLQVLDEINSPDGSDFWETQKSRETATRTKLGNFKSTPFENNDPVIFGFDIIIDDVSSPLLNGSINDFLNLFGQNISEINSRKPVYEDFKQQFIKFFKTKATVRIDDNQTSITKMRNFEAKSRGIFSSGETAYLNYYLKKISGLEKLIEGNTPSEKSFLTEYNKDIITLTFSEDVSLSLGTLSHLYKLLYWSKPNGKGMIPENLLRFNCDIIISEVRNFNRVRKSIETGDLEVIKDNVSRHIYSLRECQFYFNTLPHDSEVDLSSIKVYDTYTVQFDYKYSTVKFERFVPTTDGFGKYVGYDGGAIWRIGASGNRDAISTGTGTLNSVPRFLTDGQNRFNQNGVKDPLVLSTPGKLPVGRGVFVTEDQDFQGADTGLENFKEKSQSNSKKLRDKLENKLIQSLNREKQFAVNTITGILNKTLNKILNSSGLTGISPPKNVYTGRQNAATRIFYDVRGELLNFVGDSFGNILQ